MITVHNVKRDFIDLKCKHCNFSNNFHSNLLDTYKLMKYVACIFNEKIQKARIRRSKTKVKKRYSKIISVIGKYVWGKNLTCDWLWIQTQRRNKGYLEDMTVVPSFKELAPIQRRSDFLRQVTANRSEVVRRRCYEMKNFTIRLVKAMWYETVEDNLPLIIVLLFDI